MKKKSISLVAIMLAFSLIFSGSVLAAQEQSTWQAFKELLTKEVATTEVKADLGVEYGGHIQNRGDYPEGGEAWIQGPETLGTQGEGLRLEGFWIQLSSQKPENLNLEYRVHVQNEGWIAPVQNGDFAGTRGKGQRVESVEITLVDNDGQESRDYAVAYRGHVQDKGDLPANDPDVTTDWYQDGQKLGTVGESLRLEALEVKIIKKDADLTAYNALLKEIDKLVEEDYQADWWAILDQIKADNVVTTEHYQADVDAAVAVIEDARKGLREVLRVESAQAITAKQVQVVFNQAVDTSKVSFELKNNDTIIDLKVATWSKEKASAILEKVDGEFVEGNYSLTIRGLTDEPFVLSKNISLVIPPEPTTVVYGTIDETVAIGDTVYLPINVIDQYDDDADPRAYLELLAPTLEVDGALAAPGQAAVVTKATDPHYNSIKLQPKGSNLGTANIELTLSDQVFTTSLDIKAARELSAVAKAPDVLINQGETTDLKFVFSDQYGKVIKSLADRDGLDYRINLSKSSGDDDGLSLIKPAPTGTKESDLKAITVKAANDKTGVYNVEVELIETASQKIISAATTTVEVKSNASEVITYKVVLPALQAFDWLDWTRYDPLLGSIDGDNPYAHILKVEGVDGNGQVTSLATEEILEVSVVNDPNGYINASSAPVSPTKVVAQDGHYLVAAAKTADGNVPRNARLVVKIKAIDGERVIQSEPVSFDASPRVVQEIIITTANSSRERPYDRPAGQITNIAFTDLYDARYSLSDQGKPIFINLVDQHGVWSEMHDPEIIINSPLSVFDPGGRQDYQDAEFRYYWGMGIFYFQTEPAFYIADTPIELGIVRDDVVLEFTATIGKTKITNMDPIDRGMIIEGYPFEAGQMTPGDATVDYQWQVSKDEGKTFIDIEGATNKVYIVSRNDLKNHDRVRLVTEAVGNYSGSFVSPEIYILFYY